MGRKKPFEEHQPDHDRVLEQGRTIDALNKRVLLVETRNRSSARVRAANNKRVSKRLVALEKYTHPPTDFAPQFDEIRARVDQLEVVQQQSVARFWMDEDNTRHSFQKMEQRLRSAEVHAATAHEAVAWCREVPEKALEKVRRDLQITRAANVDLADQVKRLNDLTTTQSRVLLEMGERLASLERVRDRLIPRYRRENGDAVVIRDMNDAHLKNAILKVMREERDDVPVPMFRDLCVEAERRGMDWKSWEPSTEPVTKFATKG